MNKAELEKILIEEQKLYLGTDVSKIRRMKKDCNRRYVIWSYLNSFRKCQYWMSVRENSDGSGLERRLAKIKCRFYDRRRNILSERCGVEIGIKSKIGKNLDIWHGGIVINGTLGDNCTLHGNNIIGNKGKGRENENPVIGNCVDMGANAVIIGSVQIAANTIIGAGAVVVKSVVDENSVVTGVPAKKI